MVCEKASIDESYLEVTAAAKMRLQMLGPANATTAQPEHLSQIRVGLQVRVMLASSFPHSPHTMVPPANCTAPCRRMVCFMLRSHSSNLAGVTAQSCFHVYWTPPCRILWRHQHSTVATDISISVVL